MRYRRILILVALGLLLAGCGRKVYVHPELTPAQEEQDYHGCKFEAEKSAGNLSDSSAYEERVKSMIDSCMKSKGYAE